MRFLTNPRKKRRTAAQRAATRKLVALNKRRRKKKRVARRPRKKAVARRKTTSKRRAPVARRKRRVTRRRSPVRRRRRSTRKRRSSGGNINLRRVRGKVYRTNPRFGIRTITRDLREGATGAVGVLAGKAGARFVANILPIPKAGFMNIVAQTVAGLGVGFLARRFVSARIASFVLVGGMLAPVETLAKSIPIVGPLLGDDDLVMGEYLMSGDDESEFYDELDDGPEVGEYEVLDGAEEEEYEYAA